MLAAVSDAPSTLVASATPAPSPLEDEQVQRAQAAFVSHAIHELRTPLTSIRGYADMLKSMGGGELNDMQRGFIETIRANSRRMEGLLADVSDVAKIRGGTLKIDPKMDTFKNIMMVVEKAVVSLSEDYGQTVTFDLPFGLPLLNTDGGLLARALIKLIDNGLRYSPSGSTVTVRALTEGDDLLVTITDTGIGMSSEELAALGTIYYRSEREAVRAHKGSGLGIPVAFGIIRALGGTVVVESVLDAGTTVHVRMPGMR